MTQRAAVSSNKVGGDSGPGRLDYTELLDNPLHYPPYKPQECEREHTISISGQH